MVAKYINPFTDFGFKPSHEELEGYENSLKAYRDMKGVVETARKEGREEGKAEGKAEGIAESEKVGVLKVAKAMKMNGIPADVIAATTGLTEGEVQSL